MVTRYISDKTAFLYDAPDGNRRNMVLIAGDDVETTGQPGPARTPVTFRGRPGFVNNAELQDEPMLECYFIDVGQGDSTFFVTPGRKTILVDGGVNNRSIGFLVWKYRLDRVATPPVVIDLLVLTHADGDHLKGLVSVLDHPKVEIKQIIHSGIGRFDGGVFNTGLGNREALGGRQYLTTRHDDRDDLAQMDPASLTSDFRAWRAAVLAHQGVDYKSVDHRTGQLAFPDASVRLDILGPRVAEGAGFPGPSYRWFGGEAETINGHSVIFKITHGDVTILMPGDLNRDSARYLLEEHPAITDEFDCHVFKAPHHGSHDFLDAFLDACRPQITVISSGDGPDHGHPRASYVAAAGRYSRSDEPLVFSTEIAATFIDTVDRVPARPDGGEAVGSESAPVPPLEEIDAVDPRNAGIVHVSFKRRLHGMINVRSNGDRLFAARRVAAGYWWESYEAEPAPRP